MPEELIPYSIRLRNLENSGLPAEFIYDPIPKESRVQACHALNDLIGDYFSKSSRSNRGSVSTVSTVRSAGGAIWDQIAERLKRVHGQYSLNKGRGNSQVQVNAYLVDVQDSARFLDTIEIGFQYAWVAAAETHFDSFERREAVKTSVRNLNTWLAFSGLGFELGGPEPPGQIIRKDSQFIHANVVSPAIFQLHAAGYSGALQEFMRAIDAHRRIDSKTTMNEAAKSFESTMKAICQKHGWTYDETTTAQKLIQILIEGKFIPARMQTQFTSLQSLLESGVPTLRNKQAAHGQGESIVDVPPYVAAYALHLAAANIVFLMSIETDRSK